MKHITKILAIALFVFTVVATPASAQQQPPPQNPPPQNPPPQNASGMPPQMPKRFEDIKKVQQEAKEKAVEIREEVIEKREQTQEYRMEDRQPPISGAMRERCQKITQKIDKVTPGFDKNHKNQVKKYTTIVERLKKIAEKFSAEGYDTTALAEGIVPMEDLLATLVTDYEAFSTTFIGSKEFECGTSQGDFKTAMDESRTALKLVRDDIKALQEHYRTVIRPELETLKEQVKAAEGESTEPGTTEPGTTEPGDGMMKEGAPSNRQSEGPGRQDGEPNQLRRGQPPQEPQGDELLQ